MILFGIFLSIVLLEVSLRIGGGLVSFCREHQNRAASKQKDAYLILCLGESTTALGGKSAYPYQLQRILNKRKTGKKFSVINKGVNGANSETLLIKFKDSLSNYNPDMVIAMMGINDGIGNMIHQEIFSEKILSFVRSFKVYNLTRLIKLHILSKIKEINIRETEKIKKNSYDYGDGIIRASNLKEQEKMLKKIIEGDLNNDKAYVILGWNYRRQEEHEKAQEMFKKAIDINPGNDKAYISLGRYYREKEKYDEAERMLKRAKEINLNDDSEYIALGQYRIAGGGQAEEAFEKTAGVSPMDDIVYFSLGCCYKDRSMYIEAEKMFKKSIDINSTYDKIYAALAHCYVELGRHKLAEEYLQKANRVRLAYYNPMTRKNYQKLKEIAVKKGIKMVCVQYPVRSVNTLTKIFEDKEGIIFVDNEKIFKEVTIKEGYSAYFTDMFGGDFGHCTHKGNKLLAENIANALEREVFNKWRN